MANSVDKILGKFSQVVKELEDHAAKQNKRKDVLVKLYVLVDKIRNYVDVFFAKAATEEQRAFDEAKRLRKILLGE